MLVANKQQPPKKKTIETFGSDHSGCGGSYGDGPNPNGNKYNYLSNNSK